MEIIYNEGRYIEDDKYEYACDNCGKEFTSSRESLFGTELLCEECFDAYCLAEELNSWEGVEDG